jgi:hypothetical protein
MGRFAVHAAAGRLACGESACSAGSAWCGTYDSVTVLSAGLPGSAGRSSADDVGKAATTRPVRQRAQRLAVVQLSADLVVLLGGSAGKLKITPIAMSSPLTP